MKFAVAGNREYRKTDNINTVQSSFKFFPLYKFLYVRYGGRRLYQYNEDTFNFNFDLYQALEQNEYMEKREAVN